MAVENDENGQVAAMVAEAFGLIRLAALCNLLSDELERGVHDEFVGERLKADLRGLAARLNLEVAEAANRGERRRP